MKAQRGGLEVQLYSFFNMVPDGVGGQRHAPTALPPGNRPGTYCIGGSVGSGSVWTGAENLAPYRDSPRPYRVAILAELCRPILSADIPLFPGCVYAVKKCWVGPTE
jgi:hypothetical protein